MGVFFEDGQMENMIHRTLIILSIALLCQGCLTNGGEKSAPECLRSGFYAALGEQVVQADFDVDSEEKRRGQHLKVRDTYGPELRAGYRFNPYLAAEVQFQNFASADFRSQGTYVAYYDAWATMANVKGFYPIFDDFQPYAVVGVGYIDWILDDIEPGGLNRNQHELAGRAGLGFDAYITEEIVFYMEFSYTHTFDDYLKKFDLWPIAAGLQWRF